MPFALFVFAFLYPYILVPYSAHFFLFLLFSLFHCSTSVKSHLTLFGFFFTNILLYISCGVTMRTLIVVFFSFLLHSFTTFACRVFFLLSVKCNSFSDDYELFFNKSLEFMYRDFRSLITLSLIFRQSICKQTLLRVHTKLANLNPLQTLVQFTINIHPSLENRLLCSIVPYLNKSIISA